MHRDIKPANIMLNRRGGEPDVRQGVGLRAGQGPGRPKGRPRVSRRYVRNALILSRQRPSRRPDLVDARAICMRSAPSATSSHRANRVRRPDVGRTLPAAHHDRADGPLGTTGSGRFARAGTRRLACLEKSLAKRPQTARDLAALLDRVPLLLVARRCRVLVESSRTPPVDGWGRGRRFVRDRPFRHVLCAGRSIVPRDHPGHGDPRARSNYGARLARRTTPPPESAFLRHGPRRPTQPRGTAWAPRRRQSCESCRRRKRRRRTSTAHHRLAAVHSSSRPTISASTARSAGGRRGSPDGRCRMRSSRANAKTGRTVPIRRNRLAEAKVAKVLQQVVELVKCRTAGLPQAHRGGRTSR